MALTRHEEIADSLIEDILRSRWLPGERLPSERDLAARFGANRGAVREAVKKLEQLGLADVQPGGARARAIEDSSLDVLGHLLNLDEYPDPGLMEQMFEVVEALLALAVKRTVENASDEELYESRCHIARVLEPEIPAEQLIQARMNMCRHFLRSSGNLVLTLIGRALRVQFDASSDDRTNELLASVDTSAQDQCLRWLDQCLGERDGNGAVAALRRLLDLNKKLILPVLAEARTRQPQQGRVAFR